MEKYRAGTRSFSMDQFLKAFNACREPGLERDVLYRYFKTGDMSKALRQYLYEASAFSSRVREVIFAPPPSPRRNLILIVCPGLSTMIDVLYRYFIKSSTCVIHSAFSNGARGRGICPHPLPTPVRIYPYFLSRLCQP